MIAGSGAVACSSYNFVTLAVIAVLIATKPDGSYFIETATLRLNFREGLTFLLILYFQLIGARKSLAQILLENSKYDYLTRRL